MLKYSPKVFLIFRLPDGSSTQGFFRQNQRLGEIVASLCPGGKTSADQDKTVGELGLKNDTVIEVANPSKLRVWPFGR